MALREHFYSLIPDEKELDAFGLWAFGDVLFGLYAGLEFLESWNLLHGDKLMLKEDSIIGDDAPKMVQLWRENSLLL